MLSSTYLRNCEDMIRKHSSSFYQAFRLLPSPRKEAVFVIYAFCRIIDDAIDEPETSPFTLNELREGFIHLDQSEGHFIWPSLRWLFRTFPIHKDPFFTQMEGQERDLVHVTYNSLEELEHYCYQVAGTVGEMLLPVLHEAPTAIVTEAGRQIGKAMQIVNIIRDVGEDRARGRRYLPEELLKKHHYPNESFEIGLVDNSFKRVIDDLLELADQWFQEGLEAMAHFPIESRFCMELAIAYYRAIADVVIHSNHYEVFHQRAFVPDEMKMTLFKKVSERSFKGYEGVALR